MTVIKIDISPTNNCNRSTNDLGSSSGRGDWSEPDSNTQRYDYCLGCVFGFFNQISCRFCPHSKAAWRFYFKKLPVASY